jgi:hypothetical protein
VQDLFNVCPAQDLASGPFHNRYHVKGKLRGATDRIMCTILGIVPADACQKTEGCLGWRSANISRGVAHRVFNDLIDDFTKSDFKSFWDDFEIFKIRLKYGDLI